MNITSNQLMTGTGCSVTTAMSPWLVALQSAMDKFQINTPKRIAAFLANVGVESAGLTEFAENCNYSAEGLAATWPIRYSTNPNSSPKTPNKLAISLSRNPEAIANNCYANRMGNGDEDSGDGWKYRGQGPIQITGKGEQWLCAKAIGLDISNTELFQQPVYGSLSAAWLFNSKGCNAAADSGDIAQVIKLINGQPPCTANNGRLRISRYDGVLALLG